jgi:hypothetical protein
LDLAIYLLDVELLIISASVPKAMFAGEKLGQGEALPGVLKCAFLRHAALS